MYKIEGRISKIESINHYVLDDTGKSIRCTLRGKFQKEYNLKKDKLYTLDVATVGDFVKFELNEDGTGVIFEVLERRNYLSRKAPRIKGASYRGERLEQIIAANLDNLIIVTSIRKPQFNNKSVDRIIVAGESSHINVHLVINKVDLHNDGEADEWKQFYEEIGYKVYLISVKEQAGDVELLGEALKNNVNIFWGNSGVGKSSLLNLLYPELNLKVQSISDYSNKGKHTTVTSLLTMVENNTFVIDTPGVREIDPYGITKENLNHYFIDFKDYLNDCKFNTCTHQHEPGCSIMEAVESGKITLERYESYLNMLESIEDDLYF